MPIFCDDLKKFPTLLMQPLFHVRCTVGLHDMVHCYNVMVALPTSNRFVTLVYIWHGADSIVGVRDRSRSEIISG